MQIKINGKMKNLEYSEISLKKLLYLLDMGDKGIAVELNGEIIRKDSFESTILKEGDVLEIVHIVGGG